MNHKTLQIGREVNEIWVLVQCITKRSAADFESLQSPGLVTSKVYLFGGGMFCTQKSQQARIPTRNKQHGHKCHHHEAFGSEFKETPGSQDCIRPKSQRISEKKVTKHSYEH